MEDFKKIEKIRFIQNVFAETVDNRNLETYLIFESLVAPIVVMTTDDHTRPTFLKSATFFFHYTVLLD